MGKKLVLPFLEFLGVVGVALFLALFFTTNSHAVSQASNTTYLPVVMTEGRSIPDVTACKLSEDRNDDSDGLGFPVPDFYAPSAGVVNVKVLFVDFPNAAATAAPADVLAQVDDWADFFHATSYGRVTVQFDPVDNWYRLNEESDVYFSDDGPDIIEESIALADPDVDFSDADVVYIMASDAVNHDISYHTSPDDISADGVQLTNFNVSSENYFGDDSVHKIIAHELGHAFGLIDLYESEADDIHQFVGEFDVMGNLWGRAPEFLAYHRWRLGWIDDNQIYCLQENENRIQLSPIEQAGGVKAVVVPISDHEVVVIESRRALGYDEELFEEGALVYSVDSDLDAVIAGVVVYPDLGEDKSEAPLSVGESVTVSGVTVEVISADGAGDVVLVTNVPEPEAETVPENEYNLELRPQFGDETTHNVVTQ